MSDQTAGFDLVVALGAATGDGHALFGHSVARSPQSAHNLRLFPARPHELGELVRARHVELPQARQTYRFLAGQTNDQWGAWNGLNEHGVAAGTLPLGTRLPSPKPGLLGSELVRLVLERSRSACQGVDLLTDFIRRYGQASAMSGSTLADSAFLIADAREAFAVEAAGNHWVYQEVREFRSLTDVCTIRQDWDRISPGLAQRAIQERWWAEDGSKLDFAGAVAPTSPADAPALRRWGRATRLLGEQRGHIDASFLRRLLTGAADLDDESPPAAEPHNAALVAQLHSDPERLLLAWCGLGSPLAVCFPIFLDGDLPPGFCPPREGAARQSLTDTDDRLARHLATHPQQIVAARESFDRLQARFDHEADEFAMEGARLRSGGEMVELQRQATLFLEHCLERYQEVASGLMAVRGPARASLARP
jgi:hypothetical protein